MTAPIMRPAAVSAFFFLLATLNSEISQSLKVSVSIPELVKINDAFWLNCSHIKRLIHGKSTDFEEDIYAIKWYKDEEEFYRYLPNAEPKVSIYETNGIQLDQSKSHEGNVYLSKADVNSEGNYRCEILSEAPVFETVRKSKHLKVYALPVKGPKIEILDSSGRAISPKSQEMSYAVGEKIELRCNSNPSKPAARLRWYLNDHELQVTSSNLSTGSPISAQFVDSSTRNHNKNLGYDVRITPIEYRQHYKGIYSSHSTLSLVLQQDDLINSKISFKCLASLRQDVAVHSKQLIVLTPSQASTLSSRRARARRFLADLAAQLDSATVPHHRQRSQHLRHGISRLSPAPQRPQPPGKSAAMLSSGADLINSLADDPRRRLLYVYEDSDSTLGPSIIDRPDTLESYLKRTLDPNDSPTDIRDFSAVQPTNESSSSQPIEFERGDNIAYVQQIRDRLGRQRSLPAGDGSSGGLKRIYGTSSLVKSPLYLDEYDPIRPVIGWPPLESGKLVVLPPGQIVVAVPTQSTDSRQPNGDHRFIIPTRSEEALGRSRKPVPNLNDEGQLLQLMLDRLVHSINCTCTEGAIDTKMSWIVNDSPLNTRDTRYFPTRVSPDHRQTWFSIGLQLAFPGPMSLQSTLAKYYKNPDLVTTPTGEDTRSDPFGSQQLPSEQLKIICQAVHSMLLYSKSEIITFDFSPLPNPPLDGNDIDRIHPLPSNVIQATSASQSSSASDQISHKPPYLPFGSQLIFAIIVVSQLISNFAIQFYV